MIFHVVVSVYWLVKIWNSPQFPVEFRNGLLCDFDWLTAVIENQLNDRKWPCSGANKKPTDCNSDEGG